MGRDLSDTTPQTAGSTQSTGNSPHNGAGVQQNPVESTSQGVDVAQMMSAFGELLKQNQQFAKDLLEQAKYGPGSPHYVAEKDDPNPNIPEEFFIKRGVRLLIPVRQTCIAPYEKDGVMQHHPRGKKLVHFRFSHDQPITRNGRPDKVSFSGYTSKDQREVDWIKGCPLGPLVITSGDRTMTSLDMEALSLISKWTTHYANASVERIYTECDALGISRSENIDAMRSELARRKAADALEKIKANAQSRFADQKKAELMAMS